MRSPTAKRSCIEYLRNGPSGSESAVPSFREARGVAELLDVAARGER